MKTPFIFAALGVAALLSIPSQAAEPDPSSAVGHYEWRAPTQYGGPRTQPAAPVRVWVSHQAAEMAEMAPAAGPMIPVEPGVSNCECAMMRGSAVKAAASTHPDAPK